MSGVAYIISGRAGHRVSIEGGRTDHLIFNANFGKIGAASLGLQNAAELNFTDSTFKDTHDSGHAAGA